jgi:predicted ATPase
MLSRLYIHNFRTLVNFEIRFDETNLLLGANGSGKSTVFEVLRRLRGFILGESRYLHEAFPPENLTRWQKSRTQKFELDVKTEIGTFAYSLEIEFSGDCSKSKIVAESLMLDDTKLFYSKNGEAHLFGDNGIEGPVLTFDWTQSGVGFIQERKDNKKLTFFKKQMAGVLVVKPVPILMSQESVREESYLNYHMENLAAWYRYLTQENFSAVQELHRELPSVLPGFMTLNSSQAGERRLLKVEFQTGDNVLKDVYLFSELSDGQKMLIAIYMVLIGNKRFQGAQDVGGPQGFRAFQNWQTSLFIDEPDNYVSIEEIQPWLRLFVDDCGMGQSWEQIVLISHHPEVIDYSVLGDPIWFEREAESHTRTKRLEQTAEDRQGQILPLSKTIAGGLVK